jgi:uncharacterized membrane protein YcaP (DUF421 family)
MHELIRVLIAAVSAFVILFVLSKLMGKKQIAQLNFVDYVIGISLGSIAAEMAFDIETPLYYFILAMVLFFALDIAISFISRKGSWLKRVLKGKPEVIIYQNKPDYKTLKKSGLDINDLLALSREQGYFDLSQIEFALLETSGNLSIMPVGAQRPAVAQDLPIPLKDAKLPNYLVIDGAVSYSGLQEAEKDEAWLYGELNIKSKKALKNILLASYDADTQKLNVHFK